MTDDDADPRRKSGLSKFDKVGFCKQTNVLFVFKIPP